MNSSGYLNIDAILAEEERVPAEFQVGALRLGHLDPTTGSAVSYLAPRNPIMSNSVVSSSCRHDAGARAHQQWWWEASLSCTFFPLQDIEEGQRIELPIWLAERLSESKLVTIDLPRNFSRRVRESLLAAPESVRLRDRSPYFYEVGLRLASTSMSEDAARLPAALQSTLATRVHMILIKSQNSSTKDPSKFVEGLTEFEQRIFWLGFKQTKEQLRWRQGKSSEIKSVGESPFLHVCALACFGTCFCWLACAATTARSC